MPGAAVTSLAAGGFAGGPLHPCAKDSFRTRLIAKLSSAWEEDPYRAQVTSDVGGSSREQTKTKMPA